MGTIRAGFHLHPFHGYTTALGPVHDAGGVLRAPKVSRQDRCPPLPSTCLLLRDGVPSTHQPTRVSPAAPGTAVPSSWHGRSCSQCVGRCGAHQDVAPESRGRGKAGHDESHHQVTEMSQRVLGTEQRRAGRGGPVVAPQPTGIARRQQRGAARPRGLNPAPLPEQTEAEEGAWRCPPRQN